MAEKMRLARPPGLSLSRPARQTELFRFGRMTAEPQLNPAPLHGARDMRSRAAPRTGELGHRPAIHLQVLLHDAGQGRAGLAGHTPGIFIF